MRETRTGTKAAATSRDNSASPSAAIDHFLPHHPSHLCRRGTPESDSLHERRQKSGPDARLPPFPRLTAGNSHPPSPLSTASRLRRQKTAQPPTRSTRPSLPLAAERRLLASPSSRVGGPPTLTNSAGARPGSRMSAPGDPKPSGDTGRPAKTDRLRRAPAGTVTDCLHGTGCAVSSGESWRA